MFKSGHGLEEGLKDCLSITLTNRNAILHCHLLLATLPNTFERDVRFCWNVTVSYNDNGLAAGSGDYLSVCMCVTSRYCTKTVGRMITQTTPSTIADKL